MHVLVVDDELEIRQLLRRVLEHEGLRVTTTTRGAEALSAALLEDFDLLVCDLNLPDLDGISVIRAIKSQSPDLPVIVVSALDPKAAREECFHAGATCFLQKPLRLDALRRELQLVERSRATFRVMMLDPDPIHRRRVSRALAQLGCQVEVFEQGQDALAELAAGGAYTLVLLDGNEVHALQLLEETHRRGWPTFVCGALSATDEERMMRAGAAMLLQKPVNSEALLTQARFWAAR